MAPELGDRPAAGELGSEGVAGGRERAAGGPDPLDELSQRVRAAQEAAERVLAEARQQAEGPVAGGGDRPPPSGYASQSGTERRGTAEAQALLGLLELGRGLVPAELRQAMADLLRELLLVLRALIDWYLERREQRRRMPVEVEDIPIA